MWGSCAGAASPSHAEEVKILTIQFRLDGDEGAICVYDPPLMLPPGKIDHSTHPDDEERVQLSQVGGRGACVCSPGCL